MCVSTRLGHSLPLLAVLCIIPSGSPTLSASLCSCGLCLPPSDGLFVPPECVDVVRESSLWCVCVVSLIGLHDIVSAGDTWKLQTDQLRVSNANL